MKRVLTLFTLLTIALSACGRAATTSSAPTLEATVSQGAGQTPGSNTTAQLPKATKYTNVTWYRVEYYKFKPARRDEAMKIIYDHYVQSDKAYGEIIHFDGLVGEWDHIAYFRLEDGPGTLAWQVSPQAEKESAAAAKLMGGAEKVNELDNRFSDTIADFRSELVMRRKID